MAKTTWRRSYAGQEYRADSDDDVFKTKREAQKRAEYWRRHAYNVRVVKQTAPNRYTVYHSVSYSKR